MCKNNSSKIYFYKIKIFKGHECVPYCFFNLQSLKIAYEKTNIPEGLFILAYST